MEARYNRRSPAVKRLMREAQELSEPTEQYHAQPLEDNLFEWHFTIRGPSDSEFDGGIYHGRIILPPDYPMKPPSIILLTPNGRFEVYKKICLSISGHHPESWQPSWSIRTALLAIIGFMPTHGNGAIGSLDYTADERKVLAKKSTDWKCQDCGSIKHILKPVTAASDATKKEAEELAAQINFQGEKEKKSESASKPSESTAATSESAPSTADPTSGTTSTTATPPNTPVGSAPQSPFPAPPFMMPPFRFPMSTAGSPPSTTSGGFPAAAFPQGFPPFMPPMYPAASGQQQPPQFPAMMQAQMMAVMQAQMRMAGFPAANLPTPTPTPTVQNATSTVSSSSSTATPSPAAPATTSAPAQSAQRQQSSTTTTSTPSQSTTTTPSSSSSATTSPPSSTTTTPTTTTPAPQPQQQQQQQQPTGVRQRRAVVTVARTPQNAELPAANRQAQSMGSLTLCLIVVICLIILLLVLRRLHMMQILDLSSFNL